MLSPCRRRVYVPLTIASVMLLALGGMPRAGAAGAGYVVRPGDTLSGIAARFGTTVAALTTANNLANPDMISAGQVLVVYASGIDRAPTDADADAATGRERASIAGAGATTAVYTAPTSYTAHTSYTVQGGDTLSAIAQRFGMSLDALAAANALRAPYRILVQQRLQIPASSIAPAGLHVGRPLATPVATAAVAPLGSGTIGSILTAEAQAAGISISLLKAVAWQESGWRMVTAGDGGIGVMQLMPDTVTWASASLLGYQINPYNPTDNIRTGAAILRYYLLVFGDVRKALAAYNQGMGSVQQQGILPGTQSYIANILALQQRFGG